MRQGKTAAFNSGWASATLAATFPCPRLPHVLLSSCSAALCFEIRAELQTWNEEAGRSTTPHPKPENTSFCLFIWKCNSDSSSCSSALFQNAKQWSEEEEEEGWKSGQISWGSASNPTARIHEGRAGGGWPHCWGEIPEPSLLLHSCLVKHN